MKSIKVVMLAAFILTYISRLGTVIAVEEISLDAPIFVESISYLDSQDVQTTVEAPIVQETLNLQEGTDPGMLESIDGKTIDIVIPPLDVCSNIEGDQSEVPVGYSAQDDGCIKDVVVEDTNTSKDVCSNIEGDQSEVPVGYNAQGGVCIEDEILQLEEISQEESFQQEEPQVIQIEKPKSVYTFSLGTRTITTHKKVTQQVQKQSTPAKGVGRQDVLNVTPETVTEIVDTPVYDVVTPEINNDVGAISLKGFCNKKYFVVLVYKNEADYSDNPSSYIFNKAFECNNGAFSYDIKDLPSSLSDGSYYILIGEQGETGTWSPASSLAEIQLNRR